MSREKTGRTAGERSTLADLLLADTSLSSAGIRAWLPAAARYTLTAEDLARIDSYGSSDGATLHALLPLILPLERTVWYEAEVTAQRGTQMLMGYGATPAGPGEIGVWFAAHARGSSHIVGPLGPLRLDSTAIDPDADTSDPGVRELRAAAGIVIRAMLLGEGRGRPGPRPSADPTRPITVRPRQSQLAAMQEIADRQGIRLRDAIVEAMELAIARGGTR